jgi:hypothetical protein
MFASAQCVAIAGQKLAKAGLDDRHRQGLLAAAQAWVFLAGKLGGRRAGDLD